MFLAKEKPGSDFIEDYRGFTVTKNELGYIAKMLVNAGQGVRFWFMKDLQQVHDVVDEFWEQQND